MLPKGTPFLAGPNPDLELQMRVEEHCVIAIKSLTAFLVGLHQESYQGTHV